MKISELPARANPALGDLLVVLASDAADAGEVAHKLSLQGVRDFLLNQGMLLTIGGSAVAASHTGSTAEAALATLTLPALGPRDFLLVSTRWTYPNSANSKSMRVRLGGLAGTIMGGATGTTTSYLRHEVEISNRGATNSQIGIIANNQNSYGIINASPVTAAIETNAGADLVLTGQLADGAETLTLESWRVTLGRTPA